MKDVKRDAMRDLIAAVKAGDAKAAALAFQRAYEACAEEYEDEEVTESKEK